jgi:hypothetical protein
MHQQQFPAQMRTGAPYGYAEGAGPQQTQQLQAQPQQQHYQAPVDAFFNDLYKREGLAAAEEIKSVGQAEDRRVPQNNESSGMIHINRSVRFYASPRELADDPSLCVQKAIGSFGSDLLERENVKMVPRMIKVKSVQNMLPYDVGFSFDHPDEPGRKTLKMNTNHVQHTTDDKHQQVDVLVEANMLQPMNRSTPLYTTNPKQDVDLSPYQQSANLTEEGLREGVFQRNKDASDPSLDYALVYVDSPIYEIAMANTGAFPLQEGHNVRHLPLQQNIHGDTFSLCMMPGAAVDHALGTGKKIIESLPFQDPEDLVVTAKRPDGRAFDDIDDNGIMDRDTLLDTKHYFGMTIEEAYVPFQINDPAEPDVYETEQDIF